MIYETLENIVEYAQSNFNALCGNPEINHYIENSFVDYEWATQSIRKAHIQVVDNREKNGTYFVHINIFPSLENDAPIFGFDIIAGATKITGSFLDYSPIERNHFMMEKMEKASRMYSWKRERELPLWALEIFSSDIIAIGNIKEESEIENLRLSFIDLFDFYLQTYNISGTLTKSEDIKRLQNKYCSNQKLNPHLGKSLLNMGFTEEQKNNYINEKLFKEI